MHYAMCIRIWCILVCVKVLLEIIIYNNLLNQNSCQGQPRLHEFLIYSFYNKSVFSHASLQNSLLDVVSLCNLVNVFLKFRIVGLYVCVI